MPGADDGAPRARWWGGGFPALRHRNFRLFVVGQGISLIGFWMQSVAQGWLVYRLSGSALRLGAVAFAAYLPILCVAPAAGVLADRVPRRGLLIVTQSLLGLLALTLGVLAATGVVTVPLVIAVAAGVGLVSAFDVPARQAFLVEMVGAPDLPGAIALNSSLFNTARVVGPAVAGSLVGVVGEAPCFFLNAASYLAVIAALAAMRLPPASPTAVRPALGAGLRSGLGYVWDRPSLRNLLLLLGVTSGLGLQYQVLMPVYARTVFDAGATGYGLLLTAAGLGALASGLGLAWRQTSRAQQRRNLLVGLLVFSAGVLGVAASPSLPVALACQACAGFGMIRYTATTNTLLQLLVDDEYRGRVMGLHTVMFLGTGPVGSLALGGLADRLGARLATCASGGVVLACALWLALRLRRLGARAATALE